MVNELRQRTGVGMMECKKALTESDGDFEKAIELLRIRGLATAAKKEGRVAKQGVVAARVSADGKIAVLAEINCETDFVARTDEFKALVETVVSHIEQNPMPESAAKDPAQVDDLLAQGLDKDSGKTLKDLITDAVAKTGENIIISRAVRNDISGDAGCVQETYVHLGGKIGILVEAKVEPADKAGSADVKAALKELCLQIAFAAPQYLTSAEVPADVIAHERGIYKAQTLAEGKKPDIVDKIVEGRAQKYLKEVCLTEQPYIRDDKVAVKDYLAGVGKQSGASITITRFNRFELGVR
jgi:elongation factor Ts